MLLLLRGLLVVGYFALWFYCVFDVIRTPQEGARYIHKLVWLALVVIAHPIGSLAWLMLGRPVPIGSRLLAQPDRAAVAPDDSPEYLARLDEEIKRRRRAEQIRGGPEIDPDVVDNEIERLEKEFRDPDEDKP
jgi:hypothetical protein